jgi:hypothetical protein
MILLLYILNSIFKLLLFIWDIKDNDFIENPNIVKADNWFGTILEILYELFINCAILFILAFILGVTAPPDDDPGDMTFEKMMRLLERDKERERIIQELKRAQDEENGIYGENQGTYAETGEEFKPSTPYYSPFED